MSEALEIIEEECAPAYSDDALAIAFAEQYQAELRYVAAWGKWFCYNGTCWRPDETLAVWDRARRVCRDYANGSNGNEKATKAIASAATVAAVERLARADRRLAATTDQWDRDPWLLNTPAGPINLKTGVMYGHYPQYHLTRITAVSPGGECPLWRTFLKQITGGDIELPEYLARVFGYCLTGSTKEHALFFGYGKGANGKSVLLNTVANILGDYAKTAPIETFTASSVERHPTDLAGLRGARLVTAVETEEGRQWAEAKIKALTGGDKIAARFMRQDFFEYTPQFKLVIAGNHKPGLRSVDEAIRRRFNLIPFDITIPAADRDPDLAEKLKAEWPGILRWMIDGCRQWQEKGLVAPDVVTRATTEYLDQQDNLSAWVIENCQVGDPSFRDGAKTLFLSWSRWAQAAGLPPGSRTAFLDGLRKKGFEDRRTNTGSTFFGIRVTPNMAGEYP